MAIFTYILIFAICRKIPSVFGHLPPQELPFYREAQQMMAHRLVNMTAEILYDVTKKLKHAEKIRDRHKHSISYELGMIAAGLQERFQNMLKIYRKYANKKDFEANKYDTPKYLQAYHVIQGDYNEVRLEKSLFYEIKKKYESTTVATVPLANVVPNEPKPKESTKPKGGERRKWLPPNVDKFYNLK